MKRIILLFSFMAIMQLLVVAQTEQNVVRYNDGTVLLNANFASGAQSPYTPFGRSVDEIAENWGLYIREITIVYPSGDRYTGWTIFNDREHMRSFLSGKSPDFQPIYGTFTHSDGKKEDVFIDWKDKLQKNSLPTPVGKWLYYEEPDDLKYLEFRANGTGVDTRESVIEIVIPLEGSSKYNRKTHANNPGQLTGGYYVDFEISSTQNFQWKYEDDVLTITYKSAPSVIVTPKLNKKKSFERVYEANLQRHINQSLNDMKTNPHVKRHKKDFKEMYLDQILPKAKSTVSFKVYAFLKSGLVLNDGREPLFYYNTNKKVFETALPKLVPMKFLRSWQKEVYNRKVKEKREQEYREEQAKKAREMSVQDSIRKLEERIRKEQEEERMRVMAERAEQQRQLQNRIDLFFDYIINSHLEITKVYPNGEHSTYENIVNELHIDEFFEPLAKQHMKRSSKIDEERLSIVTEFYDLFHQLIFTHKIPNTIKEKTKLIQKMASANCKDVKKDYSRYISDVRFNDYFSTFAELKEYAQMLDNTQKVQNRCIEFIGIRNIIAANHDTILAKCKDASYIKDIYKDYYKTADMRWTPTSTNDKLYTIIVLQQQLAQLLDTPNLSMLNKECKKKGISNIEDIIKVLQNQQK